MANVEKKAGSQGRYQLSSTSSSDSDDESFQEVSLEKSTPDNEEKNFPTERRILHPSSSPQRSSTSFPRVTSGRQEPDERSTSRISHRPSTVAASQPEFKESAEQLAKQAREEIQASNALIEAAGKRDFALVEKLLKFSIDIDRSDIDGLTALHHAAISGCIHTVAQLIKRGASARAVTPAGHNALALAASHGNGAVVEYLYVESGSVRSSRNTSETGKPDPSALNAKTETGIDVQEIGPETCKDIAKVYSSRKERKNVDELWTAVSDGNLIGVARMIAALPKTDASGNVIRSPLYLTETDEAGKTLLAHACRQHRVDIVLLLECAGAPVDSPDPLGTTPLMHAVRERQPLLVAALMKAGARPDTTNKAGASALSLAIDSGDPAVLKALVDGGADIWNATAWGETLVVYAAQNGKKDIVTALLKAGADIPDDHGSRALARCARENRVKAVSSLLKAGADIHHKAADCHTAFTLAAANGHQDILAALLKHHATVEWKCRLQAESDNQGRTGLILATLNGKQDTVKYLLRNQADPHQRDFGGRTALLWAAASSSSSMLGALINHGATHICTDDLGDTVFTIAAEHDNQDVMEALCTPFYRNSQFDINTPNKDGDTALIKAARHGHRDMVTLLLGNGANLLKTNQAGRTALHEAASFGHTDIVADLQQAVALMPPVFPYANDVLSVLKKLPLVASLLPDRVPVRSSELDASGNSLLLLAAANGQAGLLSELLASHAEAGDEEAPGDAGDSESESFPLDSSRQVATPFRLRMPDLEETNFEGLTALALATREGHYSTIQLLLDNGAKASGPLPVQAGNMQAQITPLWLAARLTKCATESGTTGRPNRASYSPEMVVHLLLKSGAAADVNTLSWQGQTPLIAAAGSGNAGVVNLLIKYGAKIACHDMHGITPLMHAAWHGYRNIAEIMLNYGAAPTPQAGELSPLILASENGHISMIDLLAKRGAKIDHRDASGMTALIGAAKRGKAAAVEKLIGLGANPYLTDSRNKSALYYASKAGHDEVVKLLEKGLPAPRDN